ncbi:MAG TPA: methionyl-tRNA formyltransferase [bacterium]
MRIVFMGTPDFAVPSLKALAGSGHELAFVVTQPDRPKGRGQIEGQTPVKREAVRLGLPVVQAAALTDPAFLDVLFRTKADCFTVVGFSILPETLFRMPSKGAVNLHGSLLPKFRGAAPIQWAIIQGEKTTGVTTFFIRRRVDTGDILLQRSVSIGENETAGELHDRLALIGADLLLETLDLVESGRIQSRPQAGPATCAPKILPEHCEIHWDRPAEQIRNLVRGLSPRPGAFTWLEGERLKLFGVSIAADGTLPEAAPGTVTVSDKRGIIVQTAVGCLRLLDVQLENKERMGIAEFLCGREVRPGIRLGEPESR